MKEYIAKKLLLLIPTVLVITFLVFAMMRFIPGDPIHLLLGDMYDQRQADELRHAYGLDQPLLVQYVAWLARLAHVDWGQSVLTSRPVFQDVVSRLPISLELIVLSMLLALLIAIPAGVISATRPYTVFDHGAMTVALLGISMPDFFLGILLFLLFSLTLGWLPVQGYVPLSISVVDNIRHMLLPAVALAPDPLGLVPGEALAARHHGDEIHADQRLGLGRRSACVQSFVANHDAVFIRTHLGSPAPEGTA